VVSIHIGEQLARRQRRVRDLASVSDRSSEMAVEPARRIALTEQEVPSLGCCEEFFVEQVRPHMPVARRGRRRLFPADELRREVAEHAVCTGRSER